MLEVLGQFPGCGNRLSRRAWLQFGGLGWLGLSLPSLLRGESTAEVKPVAKSCVLFLLHGGPSQLDIWDMKPLAPAEVRGEFIPMATRVPGIQITEHLPRLASLSHLFTIVRSMKFAPLMDVTPDKSVSRRIAPRKSALLRLQFANLALLRSALVSLAADKSES